MIPGAALAEWIARKELQQASRDRMDACSAKWSVHPLMTQTERQVATLPERTPEALLDIARTFLDRTDDIATLMREFVATSRIDPFFRPPIPPLSSDIHNSLLLYHHPDLSIGFGVTGVDMLAAKKAARTGASSISFSGYVMLMRFVKAGGARLSFWEVDALDDRFGADRAGQCRRTGERTMADGDEIVIDGRHQSFVIEHATSDIVYFQAVARAGSAPVSAEYDGDSHAFVAAASTDEAGSRVQMMASLLRVMGREDGLPLLARTLESWPFHTRWHLMREMLAMDADAALPLLKRMAAGDGNPDIRAAARATLERFFPEEVAPAREAASCRG